MKKIFGFIALLSILALAACGQSNEANQNEEKNGTNATEQTNTTEQTNDQDQVTEHKHEYDKPDPRLQEPTADTICEMCQMKVYEADHELGKFSAQAIKEDGSIAFYDDIGCLLNAEIAHNETNQKYVRDFNTLDWVLVDDATIVKTDLKTPMNWGYAFFKNKEDAEKFVAENQGYYIEELDTVKQLAKERREKKLKEQAEKEAQGQQMQEGHEGHNHQ